MELQEVAGDVVAFLHEPKALWNRRALIFHRSSTHLLYRRHQLQLTTAQPGDQQDVEEIAALLFSLYSLFPLEAPRSNMQKVLDMYESQDVPWSVTLTAYFRVMALRSRLTAAGLIMQEIGPYLNMLDILFAPYHVIIAWLGLTMDFTSHPMEVYSHLIEVSHVQNAMYTHDMNIPEEDEQLELRSVLFVAIRNLDIIWKTRRTWYNYARHNVTMAQAEYNRSLQLLRCTDVLSLRFLSTCKAFSQARRDHMQQYRMCA